MRRWLGWTVFVLLLAVLTGVKVYQRTWSAEAVAKKAAAVFATAAVQGDVDTVQTMLAEDASVTADEIAKMFRGFVQTEVAIVPALPNQSGIEYIAVVASYDKDGVPHGSSLAMRRASGRWIIVNAGVGISY